MQEILSFIKKNKIPLLYFIKEMGYHKTYISSVFNSHRHATKRFKKLLVHTLMKYADNNPDKAKEVWRCLSQYDREE